jgi:hypothetical protein
MKAKLIKESNGDYILILNNPKEYQYPLPLLSTKNCQAIERGYDLDELAHIRAEILNSYTSGTKWADEIDKLLTRYREVIELMSDKKFNEADIRKKQFYSGGMLRLRWMQSLLIEPQVGGIDFQNLM